MKKILVLSLLLILSVSLSFGETKSITDFDDVVSNHWGIEAIKWGLSKDIIGGYANGKFGPNDQVTEAEFTAILARFCDNLPETFEAIPGKPWSEPYYVAVSKYEIPFRGYDNLSVRNSAIRRDHVAMIIAAKYGFNLTAKQAIYFMYENGLSTGKSATERTYESYGPTEPMSRTQALAFLMSMSNMEDKVMTFKGKPSIMGPADAEHMLGVAQVNIDNQILVDFSDFNKDIPVVVTPPALTDLSKIISMTTKVVDGKVVAVQGAKLDVPTAIAGVEELSMNYYTFDANGIPNNYAPCLPNTIVNFKGVDLPYSTEFRVPKDMIHYNDAETGIVQISLSYANSSGAGIFKDKQAFLSLMNNLKLLGATQTQLDFVKPIVDEWNDKRTTGPLYKEIVSKSKGTTLIIQYGRGDIILSLYNAKLSVSGATIYVD